MIREEEDLSRVMSNYEQDWRKGWVANSKVPHRRPMMAYNITSSHHIARPICIKYEIYDI